MKASAVEVKGKMSIAKMMRAVGAPLGGVLAVGFIAGGLLAAPGPALADACDDAPNSQACADLAHAKALEAAAGVEQLRGEMMEFNKDMTETSRRAVAAANRATKAAQVAAEASRRLSRLIDEMEAAGY